MSDTNSTRTNYAQEDFGYIPNKVASLLAGVLFGLVSLVIFVRLIRCRTWRGLCLPIGTSAFATGFFLRYELAVNPFSFAFDLTTQLLVIVSPAAFIAFNYILYGRLIRTFACNEPRYSLIRPRLVARVFILSDITTFLVQGVGGSMLAQSDTAKVGKNVLLGGLISQGSSYLVFILLFVYSHRQIYKGGLLTKENFPWIIIYLLYFSSAFIIIRSIYRIIEFQQGENGFLVTHEVFLYVFDTYPLFFATAVYAVFWPGQLIKTYGPPVDSAYRLNSLPGP